MRTIHTILLALLLVSCQKGLEDRLPVGEERLVIQGWVTNQMGPQWVSISTTAPVNTNVSTPKVSGASVLVFDDLGTSHELEETAPGRYQSILGFQGVIGRQYWLEVTLADGIIYQSSPELLLPVTDLENVTCRTQEGLDGSPGFEIFVELDDPPGIDNQYRWLTFINDTLQNKPIEMRIGNDNFADGDHIFIDMGFYVIESSDTIRIEQRSLTPEALDYLTLLLTQSVGLGSSFSPAPAFVPGNISNINDSQEAVLGYFGASAVSSMEVIK